MTRLDGTVSAWSGATLEIKNMDLVDLSADNVSCTTLVLDGTSLSSTHSSILDTIQHLTSSVTPDTTTANSRLVVTDDIETPELNVTSSLIASSADVSNTLTARILSVLDSASIDGDITTTGAISGESLSVKPLSNLIYTDTVNNRVGILTGTPSQTLDVTGTIKAQVIDASQSGYTSSFRNLYIGGNGSNINFAGTGTSIKFQSVDALTASTLGSGVVNSSLTSVGTLGTLAVSGDVTVDSGTFKVDSGNNRVGINKSSPATALDVVGDIQLTGKLSSFTALPTLASTDIGYVLISTGATVTWTGSAQIKGLASLTIPVGVWRVDGYFNFKNGSTTTNLVQVTYGFSTTNNAFTGTGSAVTDYRYPLIDIPSKPITFGNTYTYPRLAMSQTIQVSAERDCYICAECRYTGTAVISEACEIVITRIA